MPEIIPSFLQKIARAETHVLEFKVEFEKFAARATMTTCNARCRTRSAVDGRLEAAGFQVPG
jgi:hypothetical protein